MTGILFKRITAMEDTSYIGNSAVLELTAPPNYCTDAQAEVILSGNWDWLEPKCAALVFFAIQLKSICACACADLSVTNGGSTYSVGACDCADDPDANQAGSVSVSVCGNDC